MAAAQKCPTCGQTIRRRVFVEATTCAVCEKPIPYKGKGTPLKTHPGECRRTWAKLRRFRNEEEG